MNKSTSIRPPNLALRQAGFTLVELVTVILILGVLAAVALPRYADLQGKAREAKLLAVTGAVRSASSIVKAQALANGVSCTSATGSITMEGTAVALNHCYPQALGSFTTGILLAAGVPATDGWTVRTGTGGAGAAALLVIELSNAATPANCNLSYTSPAGADQRPVILSTSTGC